MSVKKRYILASVITLKAVEFSFTKKEDLIKIYDLLCSGEYIALIEKSIRFSRETLEYIITLS